MKHSKSIEASGKTVEEAIHKALKELNLSKDKVKIEILSEEEKGLFGMAGARLAKVKVSVLEKKEKA